MPSATLLVLVRTTAVTITIHAAISIDLNVVGPKCKSRSVFLPPLLFFPSQKQIQTATSQHSQPRAGTTGTIHCCLLSYYLLYYTCMHAVRVSVRSDSSLRTILYYERAVLLLYSRLSYILYTIMGLSCWLLQYLRWIGL